MKIVVRFGSLLLGAALVASPGVAQTAPGAAASSSGAYILGANDEVSISVYGQPDMSVKTRVKSDGTVILPLIGSVQAAGQTTAEFSRLLSEKYTKGGYLTNPSINVEVSSYISRAATVLGNVQSAGNYPLDRPYSVAMLIARAGGIRPDGSNTVVLTPADGTAPLRLRLADTSGDSARLVNPGDSLFVPPAEAVYVYGQVNQPGAFPYQAGMTYRQALARAGGPTLAGSTRKFEVRRGGQLLKKLSLDDQLQPEDVLVIKEKLF